MTKPRSERQALIDFVKFMNKNKVCGCVQFEPESIVNIFYWAEFDKEAQRQLNKNDLKEGNKF